MRLLGEGWYRALEHFQPDWNRLKASDAIQAEEMLAQTKS
jgi:hypothetical protein